MASCFANPNTGNSILFCFSKKDKEEKRKTLATHTKEFVKVATTICLSCSSTSLCGY